MIKKILSVMLVLCLIIAIPVSASDETYDDNTQEDITLTNNYITYLILDNYAKVLECNTEAENVYINSVVGGKPVTEIGEYAFNGCRQLTEVEIPAGVTKIGERAFYECEQLRVIEIPDSVTEIGEWAFEGCVALVEFVVDKDNTAFASVDDVLFSKDKRTLIKYPPAKSLSQYEIPESVRKIQDAAFRMCWKLNEIDVPKYVSQIGTFAFYGCTGLTDIKLPLCIKEIGYWTFAYCENLKSLVIPFGVTTIDYSAFRDCTKLEEIEIPWTVKSIGNTAFHNCQSLKNIEIPEGVTSINTSTFSDCTSLESIFLPSTLKRIKGGAFYCTSKLERIYYGGTETDWSNVQIEENNNFVISAEKYYNSEIDYGEVSDGGETGSETDYPEYINPIVWGDEVIISTCEDRDFTDIVIPPQINGKNVTKIAEGAFAERSDINRVILPSTVVSVGDSAFAGTNINKAYFNGTREQFSGIVFGEENDQFKNLVKIIPNGTTETTVSQDKNTFEVDFVCVENEKTVLVTLFNNGLFVGTQIGTYKGEKLIFTTDKEYTEAKVMLWDNISNMKSLSDGENIL